MIIGIDFDNTIIDYDDLFYTAGLSLGLLNEGIGQEKKDVRRSLIECGREDNWIVIQGLVYGKYIKNAKIMGGFSSFLKKCQENGWIVYIISHKTRESLAGEKYDLHEAARAWLEKKGISGPGIQNAVHGVYFELSREDKISRINNLRCNVIIDDLADVLLHSRLHKNVKKILYNPHAEYSELHPGLKRMTNWNQAYDLIIG